MLEGLANLRTARAEARAALAGLPAAPDGDDAVRPRDVPSAASAAGDRVLAEIDHDGFAFPAVPGDSPFLPARAARLPRLGNLLDLVLVDGRVCVRKRFRAPALRAVWGGQLRIGAREWALRKAWHLAGVHFYTEVAALLRLRDLPFVPRLRRVDLRRRTLWIDCLDAASLRHQAASAGEPVHDRDLPPGAARQGEDALGRREARLLEAVAGAGWRAEVAAMVREMNRRGVVPLDLKLGNLMRGRRTGRLYWIDLETARLASQPGFDAARALQDEILRSRFDIIPASRG